MFRTHVSHTSGTDSIPKRLPQTWTHLKLLISQNKCQELALAGYSSRCGDCQNLSEHLLQVQITIPPLFTSAMQQNQPTIHVTFLSCLMIPMSYYFILTSLNNLLLQIRSLSTRTFILPRGKSKFAVIIYCNQFFFSLRGKITRELSKFVG